MFGWNMSKERASAVEAAPTPGREPALLGAGCGLVEGTLVATGAGWHPVETLRAGDQVLTFDGGMQTVTALIRDELWGGLGPCPEALWPLLVQPEVIGNRNEMLVMPNQGILVESESVTDQWGDPYAVVPGAALEVLDDVERVEPYGSVEVILPVFEQDQMIFADNGALVFCESHWGVGAGVLPKFNNTSGYSMLPLHMAVRLLEVAALPPVLDCDLATA